MISKEKVIQIFTKAMKSGSTPEKLTLSFCVGIFIAFSPFPGVHTVMMFAAKWLFGLNLPVLFFATSFNNPYTMVPFYLFDYFFGYWFFNNVLGWHSNLVISVETLFAWYPKIVTALTSAIGSGEICLWSFFIGGNILGLFFALLAYPFLRIFFSRIVPLQEEGEEV